MSFSNKWYVCCKGMHRVCMYLFTTVPSTWTLATPRTTWESVLSLPLPCVYWYHSSLEVSVWLADWRNVKAVAGAAHSSEHGRLAGGWEQRPTRNSAIYQTSEEVFARCAHLSSIWVAQESGSFTRGSTFTQQGWRCCGICQPGRHSREIELCFKQMWWEAYKYTAGRTSSRGCFYTFQDRLLGLSIYACNRKI